MHFAQLVLLNSFGKFPTVAQVKFVLIGWNSVQTYRRTVTMAFQISDKIFGIKSNHKNNFSGFPTFGSRKRDEIAVFASSNKFDRFAERQPITNPKHDHFEWKNLDFGHKGRAIRCQWWVGTFVGGGETRWSVSKGFASCVPKWWS